MMTENEMVVQDQTDLLQILQLRFHPVPQEITAKIQTIHKLDVLERLIMAAANAADWSVFQEEMDEQSFRMLGERFDPIHQKI